VALNLVESMIQDGWMVAVFDGSDQDKLQWDLSKQAWLLSTINV